MKYFLVGMFILATTVGSYGQSGKIIDKKPLFFADSTVASIEKTIPTVRSIIAVVDFYSITYLSDDLKIKGFLAEPKQAGTFPCVIYNRGGNRELGALNDLSILRFLGETASWGYVAVGSQYRGNSGSEGQEEFGGRDVDEILNCIPLLAQIRKADTGRIGMYGWSRGGMMTYRALTQTTHIKAAIIGSGLADAILNTKKRPEIDSVFAQLAPGYWLNRDSVLKTRSAFYWADKICITTPLLIMAGTADWRVFPEEQFEMVSRLYELHHPVRFALFEGGQHSLIEHLPEVNHAARNFLDTYVRDKKMFPSLIPHGN